MEEPQDIRWQGHQVLRFQGFTLDLQRHALYEGAREVPLRPKSFEVLVYLARHHGVLCTKDELLRAVWGRKIVTEASLTQCLIEIRRAINDVDRSRIRTVPRRGFIFDLSVTEADSASPIAATDAGTADTTQIERSHASSLATRTGLAAVLLAGLALIWLLADVGGRSGGDGPTNGDAIALPANSIAVLPFVDMTAAGTEAYFGDGMAEEIINRLAQSDRLLVTARTSSFSFRNRPEFDISSIADRLDVTHVLEGSIRRDDERLRVTAQLIDASTGGHLWSHIYDSRDGNAIAIQEDIAVEVARALQATLDSAGTFDASTTIDPDAYERYARGRFLHDREEFVRAHQLFEEALAIDPEYGAAWTALAATIAVLLVEGEIPEEEARAGMRVAIENAVKFSPNSPEAQLRAARYYIWFDDAALGQSHYDEAIRLGANSPLVNASVAGKLALEWDLEGAIDHQRRAIRLDPLSTASRHNLIVWLLASGYSEEALAQVLAARELDPGSPDLRSFEVQALIMLERFKEAQEKAAQIRDEASRCLFRAMASRGLGDDYAAVSEAACFSGEAGPANAGRQAIWLAFNGDDDGAFEALSAASDYPCEGVVDRTRHWSLSHSLEYSPFLIPLRADPRWDAWQASLACFHAL